MPQFNDGANLSPTVPASIQAMFHQAPTENTPISILVGEIEQRCVDLERLLQEIVATLNLEGNAKWYSEMPQGWFGLVTQWTERYRDLIPASGDKERVDITRSTGSLSPRGE